MSLTIVSTPIGNYGDITVRAIETLTSCDVLICEELKPARVLLKRLGLGEKPLHQLNEHSKPQDIDELAKLCVNSNVALISDCGTPGFCDPGAKLVDRCHRDGIPVDVNPGPSSLMALLALSGFELKEFHFVGFLPAEKTERLRKVASLKGLRIPFVIMDTPYRLEATLKDLAADFGDRTAVLGVDLTGGNQKLTRSKLSKLAQGSWGKEPFVLLVGLP
jgi:16S rRNA (cytidine1402-2'-O)-methyltransferase